MVQKNVLDFPGRNFGSVPPGFYGYCGQSPCGLPQPHYNGLQAGGAVHFPAHGDVLFREKEVFHVHGNQYAHGHAERRDFPVPQVGELFPAGILVVMMVHGVVPNGNGACVKVKVVGPFCRIQCHGVTPCKAAGFPVIRVEGQAVGRREYVVGYPKVTVSEFRLEVVDVPKRTVLGFAVNIFTRHVKVVEIDVVAALGPVEHDVTVRESAVGECHVCGPGVRAAAVKVRIIVLGLVHRNIVIVPLYSCGISHVLKRNAVLEFFGPGFKGDVPKLGAVGKDTRLDFGAVTEGKRPVAADVCYGCAELHFHAGLTGHVAKNIGPNCGIEKNV